MKPEKTVKAEASIKVIKTTECAQNQKVSSSKPEPIQMPPSFKDPIFGKVCYCLVTVKCKQLFTFLKKMC